MSFIRFADRDEAVDTHLARLRVQAAANTRLSAAVYLQYNSAADLVALNARFRLHMGEGHDLWVVYDGGVNTDLDRNGVGPPLLRTERRAVVVKYIRLFAF